MEQYEDLIILGAGASNPYGYPVGVDLANNIYECLNAIMSHVERYSEWYTDPSFLKAETRKDISYFEHAAKILRDVVRAESIRRHGKEFETTQDTANEILEDIKDFFESLTSIGQISIDEFLKSKREDIQMIGKAYISAILILCEDPGGLMRSKKRGTWYSNLCDKLFNPFDDLKDFDNRGIHVVTFNYDRSLEQYLYSRLRNLFPNTDQEVIDAIGKLKITHVHGIIGNLFGTEKRAYGGDINPENIRYSANCINIIHDHKKIEESGDLKDARALTKMHKRFHFVGFGYDYRNILRLKLEEVPIDPRTGGMLYKNKSIFGMNFDKSPKTIEKLKSHLNNKWENHRVKMDLQLLGCQNINSYFEEQRNISI